MTFKRDERAPLGVERVFRVGTRGSELALAQTEQVIERLQRIAPGSRFEVRAIKTVGDLDQTTPLSEMGGRGVFVREVERALLEKRVDFAVHSLKDLPATFESGLALAAVPEREDPRDALVSREGWSMESLPANAVVGTGSPRREAQLLRARSDLVVRGIRGNVGTRVGRVMAGELDATVLAVAGLKRLGVDAPWRPIPVDQMTPAPCQGALALQSRADDDEALAVARGVDEPDARFAVEAERALLRKLKAGCHAPVGIYCRRVDGQWLLEASAFSRDGGRHIGAQQRAATQEELVEGAYEQLAAMGAVELIAAMSG